MTRKFLAPASIALTTTVLLLVSRPESAIAEWQREEQAQLETGLLGEEEKREQHRCQDEEMTGSLEGDEEIGGEEEELGVEDD